MTETQYRLIPGLRSSDLKPLADCPARLHWQRNAPRESTAALRRGAYVHALVLDPSALNEFTTPPEHLNRRTAAGKADYASWEACTAGKTILSASEVEEGNNIAIALRAWQNPDWQAALASPKAAREKLLTWTDAATGVQCKCRVDLLDAIAWDIKTARSVALHAFRTQATQLGYHLSAAFYLRGIEANGIEFREWNWVAVEGAAPHFIRSFRLTPEDRAKADVRIDELLATYAECERTGVWTGYPTEPQDMPLPPWAFGDKEPMEFELDGETVRL
jgi:exodeoxyribonuclease VIII